MSGGTGGGLGAADLARLGAVAEAAARLGGGVVAEHFGRLAAGVHSKAPGDYVSEVDLRSEETVREALARDAPGIAFFGEE
ncbi:MAG TPA: inositol monophosphatase, partial [Acidimicrobiia bacterium]|nr:inositol monophosphatase [Acidimicrobiia bacterium]